MADSTVLLIDGDQYLYRSCAAVETEIRWDDENHVLYSNIEEAWELITESIKALQHLFDTKDYVLCLTGPDNFRKKIDPTYKGHRINRKPLCWADCRARLIEAYNTMELPHLEADDVMGILATKPGSTDTKIIVAMDKDMKTVPAHVWNGKELCQYDEEQADYWHMYQTLTGDSSDGYKGGPGVGPGKAEKVRKVAPPQSGGEQGVGCYTRAGLTEEDALVQARLARILRWSDWDSEKKEPILWQP